MKTQKNKKKDSPPQICQGILECQNYSRVSQEWWYTPLTLALWESEARGLQVQEMLRQFSEILPKN